MIRRTILFGPLVFVLVPASGAMMLRLLADKPSVSQTTSTTTEEGGTTYVTYTFTVTGGGTAEVRDVHIKPGKGRKFWKPPCGNHYTTQPTNWSGQPTGSGIDYYLNTDSAHVGDPITDGQTGSFSIKYVCGHHDTPTDFPCTISLTTDGEKNDNTTCAFDYEGPFYLPQKSLSISTGTGSSSATGGTIILGLDTTEVGYAYDLYLSQLALGEGVADSAGEVIGVDTTSPIPSSWGLVVRDQRGVFRVADGTAQPQIQIPSNSGLVGNTFYVVAAIDGDHDGRHEIFSDRLQFTITN